MKARSALFILFGSTFFTLLLSGTAYGVWIKYKQKRLYSGEHTILSIIQTGPEKEGLQTAYLAELLGLSVDQPVSLFAFDIKKAEKKLLSSPLIAKGKIKRAPPSAIYIDYEVRKPIARLADFSNSAIDQEGYVFPIAPFFSPKNLPEVYLGMPVWTNPISGPHLDLAKKILKWLEDAPWKEGVFIKRIDVSNAFQPSLGEREIVLLTEETCQWNESGIFTFPKILRLASKNFEQQLEHFFVLKRNMVADYKKQLVNRKEGGRFSPRIVDLRIPQLAFVEKGT